MNRRCHRQQSARAGVTVIELLVAAAVCSILMALIAPAVMRTRESARRLQCQNNLRQLGLAATGHQAANQRFPYTAMNALDPNQKILPAISPLSPMLPYLDQAAVYDRVDFSDATAVELSGPVFSMSPTNLALISVGIPVFRCPSDRDHRGTNYRANMGPSPFVYWFDNMGCASPGPKPGAGAFVHQRSLTSGEFPDGLANTIFFSERVVGSVSSSPYDPWRDVFCARLGRGFCSADEAVSVCQSQVRANSPHASAIGSTWIFGGWQHTWYNHVLPPNSPIPDGSDCCAACAGGGDVLMTVRSEHPGGVNVVMGDGAARFVSDRIDISIWQALSTRAGSAPTSGW